MSAPVCRACGSPHTTLRGRKHGSFLRREFEFHVCSLCGLMFVEPFSGFEIYNDAYYRGEGPDPYVDYEAEYHRWDQSDRLREFEDLAGIAASHLAASANPEDAASPVRWLDFGCGAGAFLKFLRARATLQGRPLSLTGHDVGSYADLLRSSDGFRILSWEELHREPSESFDLISMIEVLEHLPEPLEPLELVARLLKPGGMLLLTTGNLESPVARRQGLAYRYCAPEIHVSLYNPRCLTRLYERVGLSAIRVRYRGAVQFKVLKTLRHRRAWRALSALALRFPPVVRAIDVLYGVSAMPCALKARRPA